MFVQMLARAYDLQTKFVGPGKKCLVGAGEAVEGGVPSHGCGSEPSIRGAAHKRLHEAGDFRGGSCVHLQHA